MRGLTPAKAAILRASLPSAPHMMVEEGQWPLIAELAEERRLSLLRTQLTADTARIDMEITALGLLALQLLPAIEVSR